LQHAPGVMLSSSFMCIIYIKHITYIYIYVYIYMFKTYYIYILFKRYSWYSVLSSL
jgi:hypothetical protein